MGTGTEGYWYLHTNGERFFKPAVVVDSIGAFDYFNSPFVKKFWRGTRDDNRSPEEKLSTVGKSGRDE